MILQSIFIQIISDDFTYTDYVSAISTLVFLAVLFFSLKEFFEEFEENYSKLKSSIKRPTKKENIEQVLTNYFPYFKKLNSTSKKNFIRRVEVFLDMKSFIPRQFEANEKLNILITATGVQLTFGLEKFTLLSFKKILIYPNAYYSKIRNQYHKGEINTQQRIIVLSAKHFLDGIQNHNDGINLGLHEMAHALSFESYINKNEIFYNSFKEWKKIAELEMINIKNNSSHFLRAYAATNIQEMFSVCTEYFFEKPNQFQKTLPKLFFSMVVLLKQNPINYNNPLDL